MAKKSATDTAPEATTTEQEAPATAQVQAPFEAPSLGLQDIQNVLKIIDFAADQGVFKGWATIQQVFTVREKVAAFVAFAQANADEPAPTGA
jgi:hypothetical protein